MNINSPESFTQNKVNNRLSPTTCSLDTLMMQPKSIDSSGREEIVPLSGSKSSAGKIKKLLKKHRQKRNNVPSVDSNGSASDYAGDSSCSEDFCTPEKQKIRKPKKLRKNLKQKLGKLPSPDSGPTPKEDGTNEKKTKKGKRLQISPKNLSGSFPKPLSNGSLRRARSHSVESRKKIVAPHAGNDDLGSRTYHVPLSRRNDTLTTPSGKKRRSSTGKKNTLGSSSWHASSRTKSLTPKSSTPPPPPLLPKTPAELAQERISNRLARQKATFKAFEAKEKMAEDYKKLQARLRNTEKRYADLENKMKLVEGKNDLLKTEVVKLEEKNQCTQDTLDVRQHKYEALIDAKDKEILELGETIDRVMAMEKFNNQQPSKEDATNVGEMDQAKETIQSLQAKVISLEKANCKLREEEKVRSATSRNTDVLLKIENDELKVKLESKDDTIAFLMDQLKQMKCSGNSIDGSDHIPRQSRISIAGFLTAM